MAPFEWLARESPNPNIQQTTSASDQRLYSIFCCSLYDSHLMWYVIPCLPLLLWPIDVCDMACATPCSILFSFVQRSLINVPSVKQSSRSSWLTSCTSLVHSSSSSMEYALGSEFNLMPKTNNYSARKYVTKHDLMSSDVFSQHPTISQPTVSKLCMWVYNIYNYYWIHNHIYYACSVWDSIGLYIYLLLSRTLGWGRMHAVFPLLSCSHGSLVFTLPKTNSSSRALTRKDNRKAPLALLAPLVLCRKIIWNAPLAPLAPLALVGKLFEMRHLPHLPHLPLLLLLYY